MANLFNKATNAARLRKAARGLYDGIKKGDRRRAEVRTHKAERFKGSAIANLAARSLGRKGLCWRWKGFSNPFCRPFGAWGGLGQYAMQSAPRSLAGLADIGAARRARIF